MQNLMPPVNTPDNLFHDGNDATGVEGTILYADFMNDNQGAIRDTQQEIINVLAKAGFLPDPLKNNQLLLAIQKLMGTAVGGLVKSVNNYDPDTSGNVELPMPGIGTNAVALSTANALTELCNYGGGKFTASAGSSGMPTNAVAYALDWTPTAGVGGPANGVTGTVTAVALQDVQGTNARTRYYNVCVNGRFLGWEKVFSTYNLPTAAQLQAADVRNNFAAAMGVNRVITNGSAPTSPGVWYFDGGSQTGWAPERSGILYCTSNRNDLSVNTDTTHRLQYLFIGNSGALYSANASNGALSAWTRYFTTSGGTINGPLTVNHTDFINKVGVSTYTGGDGKQHNQANGVRFQVDGARLAELYYNETQGVSADVSLHNHYGTSDAYLTLRNDGLTSISGVSPQLNFSNGTRFASDGNIFGAFWGNDYLSNWITNKIINIGSLDVAGNQWWVKINLNGGTLIVQGGYAEVRDAEVSDYIPLNIAVPNRLLHVAITNKNFAQGYATYNPQVTDLAGDRGGFTFVHGQKERMIYWLAVAY